MKWIKQMYLAVALGVVATMALQAAPVIEEPAVMSEAMLSVTVSDLHGLIDGVGSVAAQVSPMMNSMMLKNMLGMQLGDPGLVGIAPGKGFSVVALDITNIFAVIEVAESQFGTYTNALGPQGIKAQYEKGLMIVGQTEAQVAKGVALAERVKATLLSKRSPTLRIAMQPAAIVERNDDQIQGLLGMMPIMMQAAGATLESVQSTSRILEGELRVLLSVAGQCEVAEVVLAPRNGSLRIRETFVPKAGSRLATLCDAPVVNTPNAKINSGYLGGGAMKFDATMGNPEALMDFMVAEAEHLSKEMEITDFDLPALVAIEKKWWAASGGSISEVVGFGDSGMNVGFLMDIKDEAEVLALLKGAVQDFEPMFELYKELDIPMTMEFKENVRDYDGVKIHQLVVGMSMTNQPAEVVDQLASFNLTNMVYDIAITDGTMVLSMGNEKVETLIDRLADEAFKPAPLQARGNYPDGGFYYFDYDMGEYMAFISSFMPDAGNPMLVQQMATLFQGVEPVTSAGFKADGRVMWSVNMPGELLAKYGQMVMMMQMQ